MDKESKVTNRLDSWLSPVINSIMIYKGQIENMSDLPKIDNRLGDVYYVISEGKQYAYNGMDWELIDDTHGEGGGQLLVNYKGIKNTIADLPVDSNEIGDIWYVTEDSSMHMWNGASWDSLGEVAPPVTSVDWDDITNKPDTFYTHPTSPVGAKENGFYKIAIDANGHVIEVTPVTMNDLVEIGIVRLDEGKLVSGDSSISNLSIENDSGGAVSIAADTDIAGVQIEDESGKVLPIGIVNGESTVGADEVPVDSIYVNDIDDVETAYGTLVPNINTMKGYVNAHVAEIDSQISAEVSARKEQDLSLQEQIDEKASAKHSHEMTDVTGLNDKISEIETSVDSKADAVHTHATADVTGFDAVLSNKSNVGHTHEIANVNGLQTALDSKAISTHEHSAENITSGVLSADRIPNITDAKITSVSATKLVGTVSETNLPSYVDDVIEYESQSAFPQTGESGKIYVDTSTNKTYRWSGSIYVEISASLAIGETESTAFRGDYGNVAYQHAQAKGSQFASGMYKIETNAEGHIINANAVTKSDITALGVPAQDTTYADATVSASGLMSAADKTKLDGIEEGANNFHLPEGGSDGQYLKKSTSGLIWGDIGNATVSTPGLMSAEDKEKLDSIVVDAIPDSLSDFGVTATADELNYMDGVTSDVQTQLNGKADIEHVHSFDDITDGILAISKGGTGANNAEDALTNLGLESMSNDEITSIWNNAAVS